MSSFFMPPAKKCDENMLFRSTMSSKLVYNMFWTEAFCFVPTQAFVV